TSKNFTVVVKVTAATGTTVTNTACIHASNEDTSTAQRRKNDCAQVLLLVIRSADLRLTKDDNSPGFITAGLLPTVLFTIRVHNNGPGVASPTITMTDLIPSGTTLLTVTAPSGWLCSST